MKKITYAIIAIVGLLTTILFIGLMVILVNVLNSDFYGRLTETRSFELFNSEKGEVRKLPKITLILHKYVEEENSIEASLVLNYQRSEMFQRFETDTLEFTVQLIDGYSFLPTGLNYLFNFSDDRKRDTYGFFYAGFETDRFIIPITPSMVGFPFDEIKIRPLFYFYINGMYSELNFEVQKRISGRILSFPNPEKDEGVISLTRTPTEKYLVIISSFIFLLLTAILTYGLIKTKKGLRTVEELVAVAGYILATAGFKELVGFNRNNGTSALEILVILIPLLSVFFGLSYSLYKAKKTIYNEKKNVS